MSNPKVAGEAGREEFGIKRTPIICPFLSGAKMIAQSQKLIERPGEIGFSMPSVECVREKCALFQPLDFDKFGNVLYGSCALQLIPAAINSLQGTIERATGLTAAPPLAGSDGEKVEN